MNPKILIRPPLIRLFIGFGFLFFGVLFYVYYRQNEFLTSFGSAFLGTQEPNRQSLLSGSLPSYIHVFSFILITSSMCYSKKITYLYLCLIWFGFDAAFEFGQGQAQIVDLIPTWFNDVTLLKYTRSYFLNGAFDYNDVLAITAGSFAAYMVLLTTHTRVGEKNEAIQ